jgi:hypothetical protein
VPVYIFEVSALSGIPQSRGPQRMTPALPPNWSLGPEPCSGLDTLLRHYSTNGQSAKAGLDTLLRRYSTNERALLRHYSTNGIMLAARPT